MSPDAHDKLSDHHLVNQALLGNQHAYALIMQRYQGAVRAFLRNLSLDSHLADDLAQNAFLKAWQRLGQFRFGELKSWLFQIAYREFLMHRRTRNAAPNACEKEPEAAPSSLDVNLDIQRALAKLPDTQRQAVVLTTMAGLSHSEAAQWMNIPLGTLKSHVRRGHSALQTFLQGDSHDR